MTLDEPWALWALVGVGLVAAWALFRPGRQLVVVGALTLWRRAADTQPRAARRRSRKISPAWALLLAGAVAAVLAWAGPVHHSEAPSRRAAVALWPSAEAGGVGDLTKAAAQLLQRLDARDRVRLLLPSAFGADDRRLSPDEARRELALLSTLPARARDLVLPPAGEWAQHVYHFAPQGASIAAAPGPDTTVVRVRSTAPRIYLDAFAATPAADGALELFFAVRNRGAAPWSGRARLAAAPAEGAWQDVAVSVPAGGRADRALTVPAAETLTVALLDEKGLPPGGVGGAAFLVRRPGVQRTVALIGRDEPLLRRYVRSDPSLRLVGDPREADLTIANGAKVPPARPTLAIHPPSAPAGWRLGPARGPVDLGACNVAADDPVMREVGLRGVAVRGVAPWVPLDMATQRRLCTLGGEALILRNDPDEGAGPRRIYVAWDVDEENTNFAMSASYVVFLANAVRWLAPGRGDGAARYESLPPLAALGLPGMPRAGRAARSLLRIRSNPLPAPGVYSDPRGGAIAVSLVGVGPAGDPQDPDAAVPPVLPDPAPATAGTKLWWIFAVAAMAFWTAGWAFRTR